MKDIPEADWKLLRLMKDTLLRRASRTAIERINSIVIKPDDDPHKIYLGMWESLRAEDRMIADMFDDMKRSTAILKIVYMIRYQLLTPEELKGFTHGTVERARELGSANKAL